MILKCITKFYLLSPYSKLFGTFLTIFYGIWIGSSDWISKSSYWWKRVRIYMAIDINSKLVSFDGNKPLFWQAWRDGINENIFSIFSVISIQWSSMSLCYTLLVLKSPIVEICLKMSKLHMVLCIVHNFSRKIVMPSIYNIYNAWNWCDLKYKHKLAWMSCKGALKRKSKEAADSFLCNLRTWPILVHLDLSCVLVLWTQMYMFQLT